METALTAFISQSLDELAVTLATKYDLDSDDVRETIRGASVEEPKATPKTKATTVEKEPKATPTASKVKKATTKKEPKATQHESLLHPDLEDVEPEADSTPKVCNTFVKSKNGACGSKAKEEHNGTWYCGRHIAGAKKEPASKTTKTSKAPAKKEPKATPKATKTAEPVAKKPPVIAKVEKTKTLSLCQILDKNGAGTGKYWDAKTRILFNKQTREAYAVLAENGKEMPLGDEQIRFLETNHISIRQPPAEDEEDEEDEGNEDGDEDVEEDADEEEEDDEGLGEDEF